MVHKSKSPETVDFSEQKGQIIAKVESHGDIKDISSWRKAFPDTNFMDVDDGMTGKPINWEQYTPTEKAAYVAYMVNPQAATLIYDLDTYDINERTRLTDSERIWYCWFYHCMVILKENGKLSDDALETLLWYTAQQVDYEWLENPDITDEDELVDMTPPSEITVDNMKLYTQKLDL